MCQRIQILVTRVPSSCDCLREKRGFPGGSGMLGSRPPGNHIESCPCSTGLKYSRGASMQKLSLFQKVRPGWWEFMWCVCRWGYVCMAYVWIFHPNTYGPFLIPTCLWLWSYFRVVLRAFWWASLLPAWGL